MKLGVIGAGNMASAIVKGVLQAGVLMSEDVYVSDIDIKKAESMAGLKVNFSADNATVFEQADVIIFAVKPQVYPKVLDEAAKAQGISDKLLVTIAPGITIADVKSHFKQDVKVVRAMPNTSAVVGESMTVLCYEPPALEQDYACCSKIFGAVGKTAKLSENLMDAAVALNGSSPAYVYLFIEAMADAAVSGGIPRDFAYEAAAQSVLGAAKMVLETKLHPGELKDMVCSPGGTTIEAVKVLEERGFRSSVIAAMDACTKKAKNISKK